MGSKSIIIYHTTDLHNRRKAFSYFKTLEKKSDNILILDSGDAILGSSSVFINKETILDDMKNCGYDAIAVGNREFHYFRNVFEGRARQVNIPFISANMHDLKNEDFIKPFIIKEVEELKIGITGITPIQYSKKSFLKKITSFEFLDYKQSLENVFKSIEKKVDLIIVLAHLEFKKVESMAKQFKESLIFLGGHDHRILFKPIRVNNSYLFYSGCYGSHITKINLKIHTGINDKKFEIENSEVIEIN